MILEYTDIYVAQNCIKLAQNCIKINARTPIQGFYGQRLPQTPIFIQNIPHGNLIDLIYAKRGKATQWVVKKPNIKSQNGYKMS